MTGMGAPRGRQSMLSRRRFLAIAGGAACSGALPSRARPGQEMMLTRNVPSSGEALPVIGLGTWQTFDVGPEDAARAPLREVLRRFFSAGARVIDSSPMYGRSEAVVGDLVRGTPWAPRAFVATKVWITGRDEGQAQMTASERRMGGRIDLMQIHNLVDWKTHLPVLRAWKAAGRIRYLGITHYGVDAFDEMERILRSERIDFVQLPYSVGAREAEKRLLPAARDAGTAVVVMRPFERGSLFREARARPLPAFARELGAASWAQLFLKFILAHPAVTVVIPATADPEHVSENLGAGFGPLPTEELRRQLLKAIAG